MKSFCVIGLGRFGNYVARQFRVGVRTSDRRQQRQAGGDVAAGGEIVQQALPLADAPAAVQRAGRQLRGLSVTLCKPLHSLLCKHLHSLPLTWAFVGAR